MKCDGKSVTDRTDKRLDGRQRDDGEVIPKCNKVSPLLTAGDTIICYCVSNFAYVFASDIDRN